MTHRSRFVLAVLVLAPAIVVGGIYAQRTGLFSAPRAPGNESMLPSLSAAASWFNGGAVTREGLRGHPTVIVVWSDADPRSLRALPEVEAWHVAYERLGVRVIGIYAPEFRYGTDPAIAARIVDRLGLTFPVGLDPGYVIQSKLAREGDRPAIVVADTLGRIVHRAGGHDLASVDRAIRAQLRKLNPSAFPIEPEPIVDSPPKGPQPRFVYLGAARVEEGPLANAVTGRAQTFTAQFRFQEEGTPFVPYPVGRWMPRAEGLEVARGGAATYLGMRYEGGHAMAVMQPPGAKASRVWVLSGNDWMPRGMAGDDVRFDAAGASYIEVTEPRMYSIAHGDGEVLRLSPDDTGLTLYTLVFERDDVTVP